MPINLSRRLTGRKRSAAADRQLGLILTFIAGAINAGGFLAVAQYTSHMTGIVSSMADSAVSGAYGVVAAGLVGVLSFIAGAACSCALVIMGRSKGWTSVYALPLLIEALLLICFGALGSRLAGMHGVFVPLTVMLLCFIMGLQNAVITKVSAAAVRTTHLTGTITDIGIELGRLVHRGARASSSETISVSESASGSADQTPFDAARLVRLVSMVAFFLVGGIVGAVGFRVIGYVFTIPLALLLMALALGPAADDVFKAKRGTAAG